MGAIRSALVAYFQNHTEQVVSADNIALAIGKTREQVMTGVYSLIASGQLPGLYRQGAGFWLYNPHESDQEPSATVTPIHQGAKTAPSEKLWNLMYKFREAEAENAKGRTAFEKGRTESQEVVAAAIAIDLIDMIDFNHDPELAAQWMIDQIKELVVAHRRYRPPRSYIDFGEEE